ncbi:MAG: hypothetical protein ACYSWO_12830 [Planctomycetota bacterium]
MKIPGILLLASLLCLSAGCKKYYYQEGKTFDECEKDGAECVAEMRKRVADQSESSRGYQYKYVEECMKRKGYRLVTEGELPLNVKRLEPDEGAAGFLYGRRRGIAGTLDEE